MAARSLRYKWTSSYYRVGRDDGVRLRVEVVAACGMSADVFAYRMLPLNPQTGAAVGTFSHICSPVDLAEYPEAAPTPGSSPEWFRLPYVDLLVRSTAEANYLLNDVRSDLSRLKLTLDRLDTLLPGMTDDIGTVTCVETPTSSSSESASDSESEPLGPLQSISAIGTSSVSLGTGIPWVVVGTGAGSPIDDANVSTIALALGQVSQTLIIQSFNFSALPANAKIAGIAVSVWLRETGGGSASSADAEPGECRLAPDMPEFPGPPLLRLLALHQPAVGPTENKATGEVIDSTSFAAIAGGDDSDLWRIKHWTAPLIKAGEFGIMLVVGTDLSTPFASAAVDGAEITVYYR